MSAPNIVLLNVELQVAPTPSTLQQTGALLSVGGTVTSAGQLSFLTQLSDLTPLLSGNTTAANELTAMATTFFAQGSATGVYVLELGNVSVAAAIAYLSTWLTNNPGILYGVLVPEEWDGNAALLSLIASYESTTSKFYFWITTNLQNEPLYTALMKDVLTFIEAPQLGDGIANDPGYSTTSSTGGAWSNGTISIGTSSSLDIANGSWFQTAGFTPSAYNGWFDTIGNTGHTLTALAINNPGTVSAIGSVLGLQVSEPGAPATEFTAAAAFRRALNYNPSNTNKVAPFGFGFTFGVTPFPTRGMGPTLQTLQNNSDNVMLVGAEGGISNTAIYWGHTKDGNPFNFWYSIDWMQIQAQQALANEVLNGSNNSINPLYYNQDGINRLQQRLVQVAKSAVAFGLALGAVAQTQMDGPAWATAQENGQFAGQVVVNAVPGTIYWAENPGDYKIGKYAGFSILYVPLRGFEQVLINIVASQFPQSA